MNYGTLLWAENFVPEIVKMNQIPRIRVHLFNIGLKMSKFVCFYNEMSNLQSIWNAL